LKIGLVFNDAKADRRQFAHGRAERGHFAFTALQQSLVENAHIGVMATQNEMK
jgi:hypothetical protein